MPRRSIQTLAAPTPTDQPADPLRAYLREVVRDAVREALAEQRAEPPPGGLVTIRQLCQLLGLSEPTVRRHTASGLLPSHRLGDALRYDLAEVRAALDARRAEEHRAPRRVSR